MLNLKQLAYITEKNQSELGHILGVPQSAVSYMMNGFRRIRPEHIKRLKEAFGDSVVESCMESDERIDAHAGAHTVQATILYRDVVEDIEEMAHPKREDLEIIDAEEVPIISQELARIPNLDIFSAVKSGQLEVQRKTFAEILPNFDAKVYAYSSAMSPVINPGDPMLVRLIPKDSPIIPGEIYLIDTPAGLIARTVKESGDKIICSALNPAYDEVVLPREQIFSIAQVVMVLKRPTNASFQDHILSSAIERRDKQIDNALRIIEKSCDRADRLIEQFILKK